MESFGEEIKIKIIKIIQELTTRKRETIQGRALGKRKEKNTTVESAQKQTKRKVQRTTQEFMQRKK